MRRTLAVPILLLALVAAAACTDSAEPGIATANGAAPSPSAVDDQTALRHFAQCMRDHGQSVPDPEPDVTFPPRGPHDQAWDAAATACEHLLPGGGDGPPGFDPQTLEQLRLFAVCMREHDIEMSDPELPGAGTRPGNMTIGGRLEHVTRVQLEADPGFQAAMTACQDKLPVDPKGEQTP